MGDLSKFESKFSQPLNQRLEAQIAKHNDRVNNETIENKIQEHLSGYVT